MHSTVPDNSRLGSLAAASPDVDAIKVTSLARLSCREELRAGWVGSLKVLEELRVVRKGVVRIEPGQVWCSSSGKSIVNLG